MPAAVLLLPLVLAQALLAAAPGEPWEPPAGEARERLAARLVRAEGEPGFFRAAGGAYVVRTDVGREFALDAACALERFRSQFRAIFRDPPAEPFPPLVVIFRDEARYRRAVGGGASRGTYLRRARTLYTYLDRAKGERDFASFYSKILLHEGAHQLLDALCERLPVWFDEGVAAYFQEWDLRAPVAANLARLRTTHFRFADVRAAFGTPRWVPLARLVALEGSAWAPDDFGPATNLHYAEAASFIAFLVASPHGQGIFGRIYEGLRGGRGLAGALDRDALGPLGAAWEEDVAARIAAAGAGPP
jgi:hypothetical protein